MTMRAGGPRIASRGSKLALWQAHHVARRLSEADGGAESEIVVVRTTGDRITDVPLSHIGDRGLFTKELDAALLNGSADLAVHSLKDIPTRLPDGLVIAAISEREDPRDALLLAHGAPGSLETLPHAARVGTSSLRRRAQLIHARPDLQVLDLRGNLDTRLARLDAGDYEAVVLAAAGVTRLGWGQRIAEKLDPAEWLPAVGQGALAVVTRAGDSDLIQRLQVLHHAETGAAVTAERAFLHALQGGCQIPIGALATCERDTVRLAGLVASLDGAHILRGEGRASLGDPATAGLELAAELRAAGADRILSEIRGFIATQVAAP
jgi:hydroxymethylbilane synthase